MSAPKLNTNLHRIFHTVESLEEDGAWVEVNAITGLSIKLRRMKSDKAAKIYERIVREELGEKNIKSGEDISPERASDLFRRQLAEAILIDWKNLRDAETGEEIPYSIDAAYELLTIRDFREFVVQAATERDHFREKAEAEAEGNS